MALVEYSDSESSDKPQSKQALSRSQSSQGVKRKHSSTSESTLPPLPDNFHNFYASTARRSKQDDPTLHGGRQRVKPHVEGNWPTHVYVECESIKFFQWLYFPWDRWLMAWRVSFNRMVDESRPCLIQFQRCTKSPRASSPQSSEE